MRLLTLNIWNYQRDWRHRSQWIARLIATHTPDVVCLQETRQDFRYARGRNQGEQIADRTGMIATTALGQWYWRWPRIAEGLTILTRQPPARRFQRVLTQIPGDPGDRNRRVCLAVRLRVGEGDIDVYNCHFALSAAARLRNAAEVCEFVRAESGDGPALLAGDLNAAPDDPPLRLLTGELADEATVGDFVDCWRLLRNGEPGFTDPSWAPRERIDYVLARRLAHQPRAIELLGFPEQDGLLSDHVGVMLDWD